MLEYFERPLYRKKMKEGKAFSFMVHDILRRVNRTLCGCAGDILGKKFQITSKRVGGEAER